MIVKVQIPLTGPPGMLDVALIYSEGHKRMVQAPIGKEVSRALGRDAKGYFEAEWTARGWIIGKRVAEQSW